MRNEYHRISVDSKTKLRAGWVLLAVSGVAVILGCIVWAVESAQVKERQRDADTTAAASALLADPSLDLIDTLGIRGEEVKPNRVPSIVLFGLAAISVLSGVVFLAGADGAPTSGSDGLPAARTTNEHSDYHDRVLEDNHRPSAESMPGSLGGIAGRKIGRWSVAQLVVLLVGVAALLVPLALFAIVPVDSGLGDIVPGVDVSCGTPRAPRDLAGEAEAIAPPDRGPNELVPASEGQLLVASFECPDKLSSRRNTAGLLAAGVVVVTAALLWLLRPKVVANSAGEDEAPSV